MFWIVLAAVGVAGDGSGGNLREEVEDVVVDDDLRVLDGLSAEGTEGVAFENIEALSAESVVHGADDDGLVFVAGVEGEADVAVIEAAIKFLFQVHVNSS